MSISSAFTRRQFILSSLAYGTYAFLPAKAESPAINKFEPFNFIYLTDCHLVTGQGDSFKLTQESQLFLQDAVRQINLLKPDFVIFGGDQVDSIGEDERNWQLFLDIVQALECPWFFVLGETDISGRLPVNKKQTFARDWAGRGLDTSQSYWSCNPVPGVKLIGLDTSQANSTIGDMSDQQLAWLEGELNQDISLILIASHHPLFPPAPYNRSGIGDQYLLPQASKIRQILESSNKQILSFSGHIHTSKIEREKNVLYISSPSLNVYPCAFRLVKVTPENVEIETRQVNFPALIKKAKSNLADSNLASSLSSGRHDNFTDMAAGSHADQHALLSLTDNGKAETLNKHKPKLKK